MSDPTEGPLTFEELQLATRNRGMPLEALAYDVTPTGLHYLLVHFDIPVIEPSAWQLSVGGAVERPLTLSLRDLRARPSVTLTVTLECAGNGRAQLSPRPVSQPWIHEAIGTAQWTGTPLAPILEEAGLGADAVELVFTGADHGIQDDVEHDYARSLTFPQAMAPDVLLAYEMNGVSLEPQHGYPLRLVVPGWYGMASVKWLTRIEAVSEPFQGYQQTGSYRYTRDADDPGAPVERIRVRALMIPPGYPYFLSRERVLPSGRTNLRGRAWSGHPPVTRVEVGVDGIWSDATMDPLISEHAWRGWSYLWEAHPGEHELTCRATDASGAVQPEEPPWTYGGYGNNAIQKIAVTVRS